MTFRIRVDRSAQSLLGARSEYVKHRPDSEPLEFDTWEEAKRAADSLAARKIPNVTYTVESTE